MLLTNGQIIRSYLEESGGNIVVYNAFYRLKTEPRGNFLIHFSNWPGRRQERKSMKWAKNWINSSNFQQDVYRRMTNLMELELLRPVNETPIRGSTIAGHS